VPSGYSSFEPTIAAEGSSQHPHQFGQPAGQDDGIVVQEQQRLAARLGRRGIAVADKPKVAVLPDDPQAGEQGSSLQGFVGRGIVGQDHLAGDPCAPHRPQHGNQTGPCEVPLVLDRHDDRYIDRPGRVRRGQRRGFGRPAPGHVHVQRQRACVVKHATEGRLVGSIAEPVFDQSPPIFRDALPQRRIAVKCHDAAKQSEVICGQDGGCRLS